MTAMMKSPLFALLAVTFACTMHAAPARAQAARTFVSAAGSDSNNCSNVATPCRHFAAAFAVTAVDGEIYVLDPANYGTLIITHAVSIQGHGWGSVSPLPGGAAFTIDAPSTDAVNLDGLTIEGNQSGGFGIMFNSGKSLSIEHCVIRGMTHSGLTFISTAPTKETLLVSNSYFLANDLFNANGSAAINIQSQGTGAVTASIDRTEVSGNGNGIGVVGIFGSAPVSVAVTDSVAANNGNAFSIQSTTGAAFSNLSLTRTRVIGNGGGVAAQGPNATLWLAQSTIVKNGTGYSSPGGTISSFGDNEIAGNGPNIGFLVSVAQQ
jgi:hypothetical protein